MQEINRSFVSYGAGIEEVLGLDKVYFVEGSAYQVTNKHEVSFYHYYINAEETPVIKLAQLVIEDKILLTHTRKNEIHFITKIRIN